MFPKSTHETFAQKMYQTYKGHRRFSKPKLARTDFTINHYAGDVSYSFNFILDHPARQSTNCWFLSAVPFVNRLHTKLINFLIKIKIIS